MHKNNVNDQWQGKHYHQNSDFQYQQGMAFLQQYSFRGDETVLDIGCGSGKITQKIAQYLPHGQIVGVDSSASMIKSAEENNARANFVVAITPHLERLPSVEKKQQFMHEYMQDYIRSVPPDAGGHFHLDFTLIKFEAISCATY